MPVSCQYTILPAQTQPVHHLSCPYPVRISPLLSMSSQNNTSQAHVLSVHNSPAKTQPVRHLGSPYLVRIPPLLTMLCQITTSPVSTPSLLSMSSHYSISTVHVQLVLDLYRPCHILTPYLQSMPRSAPFLQTMPNQYPISTIHFQSLPHLYSPSLCLR